MLKVGLTGSIATGKSTVLDMFAHEHIPTFSSDEAVHRLYAGAAVAPIERLFPGVTDNHAVDRTELAKRLVAAPERIRELEALVHPLVRGEIAEFCKSAEGRGEALAVADIPLLFEGGFDYGLDVVITTAVDPVIQRERAMQRPGMTVDKLDAILARQLPQAEKKRRADHVINTGTSIKEAEIAVQALIKTLKAKATP